MSWSAHQFESYVLQKHFGRRIRISYLAIVVGDMIPDSFTKVWVYGFTVNGKHLGAQDPAQFHRGWPGAGFTHSLLFGAVVASSVWLLARRRQWAVPWAVGIVVGQWAHSITDTNDTRGTMLFFPITTHNFSLRTWAYGAQVGKHHDAAAYFSSLGLVMDLLWLAILLFFARTVLTRAYFRDVIRPSDYAAWNAIGRFIPEDGQIAIYRALFVFGVARLASWTIWAHFVADFGWDLSWSGPDWLVKVSPSPQSPAWLIGGALATIACCWTLWYLVLRRVQLGALPPTQSGSDAAIRDRASTGQSVTNPASSDKLASGTDGERHHE
jgi:membrane-bound metal-dependent hydrolase YbcI (DUF457 family)